MDNFEKTLTSKYDELAKEVRELRQKIETLALKIALKEFMKNNPDA